MDKSTPSADARMFLEALARGGLGTGSECMDLRGKVEGCERGGIWWLLFYVFGIAAGRPNGVISVPGVVSRRERDVILRMAARQGLNRSSETEIVRAAREPSGLVTVNRVTIFWAVIRKAQGNPELYLQHLTQLNRLPYDVISRYVRRSAEACLFLAGDDYDRVARALGACGQK